jgi:hypothetical protein
MENKQTAVEWLVEELGEYFPNEIAGIHLMVAKAKAMEKEQIIDARVSGFASSAEGWNGEIPCMKWSEMVRETKCEGYYNETYGSQAPQRLNQANGN